MSRALSKTLKKTFSGKPELEPKEGDCLENPQNHYKT
jgi:hypothetical protein